MARRSSPSRGSSAFGRGRSPSPARRSAPPPPPPQARSVAPASPPAGQVAPQPMAAAAAPGGGLMAQVASTAAGVAIGHTVGHAITGAFMGGNHSDSANVDQQQPQQPATQASYPQHQLGNPEPCKFELEQFLSCAQNQVNDLSLCDGFNQVLRECKLRHSGGSQMY